jgi:hypothetical protein
MFEETLRVILGLAEIEPIEALPAGFARTTRRPTPGASRTTSGRCGRRIPMRRPAR